MDIGEIIGLLVLVLGIVGSVLDKRLKKTNTRKSSTPPIDPFPATFEEYDDDDESPYSYDNKTIIKEETQSSPAMVSKPSYKSVEELPMPQSTYKTVMIESASAEMKLDDLTAINLESVYNEEEDNKARAFNIDLRKAVIYSEILKPKFNNIN